MKWQYTLPILSSLWCMSVYAVDFEVGSGINVYQKQGNGTWYQEGQPYSTSTRSPVLIAGLAGSVYSTQSWGIDWHVRYVNLGKTSADCMCTPMDENYSIPQKKKLNLYDVQDARFVGNGNVQGVALTLEPYWMHKGWRFGVEAGPWFYRATWDETISNWAPGPGVPTRTISASTNRAIRVGAVVGASVSRGNLTVAYHHYFMPYSPRGSGDFMPLYKGADVVSLTYRF